MIFSLSDDFQVFHIKKEYFPEPQEPGRISFLTFPGNKSCGDEFPEDLSTGGTSDHKAVQVFQKDQTIKYEYEITFCRII
jgi:hypothetical protein